MAARGASQLQAQQISAHSVLATLSNVRRHSGAVVCYYWVSVRRASIAAPFPVRCPIAFGNVRASAALPRDNFAGATPLLRHHQNLQEAA